MSHTGLCFSGWVDIDTGQVSCGGIHLSSASPHPPYHAPLASVWPSPRHMSGNHAQIPQIGLHLTQPDCLRFSWESRLCGWQLCTACSACSMHTTTLAWVALWFPSSSDRGSNGFALSAQCMALPCRGWQLREYSHTADLVLMLFLLQLSFMCCGFPTCYKVSVTVSSYSCGL